MLINKRLCISVFLVTTFTLSLISCSSDDEQGFSRKAAPSSTVEINAENMLQIAGGVAPDNQPSSDANSSLESIEGAASANGNATLAQAAILQKIKKAVDLQSNRSNLSNNNVLLAVNTNSVDCSSSGNYSITKNILNENETLYAPGNSIEITYFDCKETTSKAVYNGSLALEINSIDDAGELNDYKISYLPLLVTTPDLETGDDVTYTYQGAYLVSITVINGNNKIAASTGDDGLYIETSTGDVHIAYIDYNVLIADKTHTLNGTYAIESTSLGGRIDVSYVDISGPADGDPTSGSMIIVGSNATLTIQFSAENVTLELDIGNDGKVDNTITVTWNQLSQIDDIID